MKGKMLGVLVSPLLVVAIANGCASSDPEGCTAFFRSDGAAVISCGESEPIVIDQGKSGPAGASCAAEITGGGDVLIQCGDEAPIVLKMGEDGEDGANCTVAESAEGSVITCPDGAEVTIGNGASGEAGDPGEPGAAGVSAHALLARSGVVLTSVCPGGGSVVRLGLDDGAGDAEADDGTLHPDEVDQELLVWNGSCGITHITREAVLEDTWSWSLLSTADLSAEPALCVGFLPKTGAGESAQSRSWMTLDLSEVPAEFESATLELAWSDGVGDSGVITVHAVEEPWTAGALDSENEPQIKGGAAAGTAFSTVDGAGPMGWVGFDVTDIVQDWLDSPSANYGLVLRSEASSWACFSGSDTTLPAALQPRLVFTGAVDPLTQE